MGLFSLFKESNTLYFPGCTGFFRFRSNSDLYLQIFSKLGFDFKAIEKNFCCGLDLIESGYESEARKLARRNFEIFKENEIKGIVTTEPGSYMMFLKNYSEIIPDWNIETMNIWEMILDKLLKKPKLIKNKAVETAAYHDSCYLGRYCGIYNAPRKILEAVGYEIIEMDNTMENSFCCGSCGGLPRTNPILANKIAKERILKAKRIGAKKMIVLGFQNYSILKKNSKDSGVRILELSEILADALGIKKIEDNEKLEKFEEDVEGEEMILEENGKIKEEEIIRETESDAELKDELKDENYEEDLK